MSKTVKSMITEVYREKFADLEGVLLVNIRGLDANENGAIRGSLAAKEMTITVVKNTLVKDAISGTQLENISDLIDGPTAFVYGGESVVNIAREVVELAKENDELEIKGAILDGTVFEAGDVERLSKFPTREEALAETVTLFLSPARNLAGAIKSPAAKIAGIIKAVEEKLDAGETIEKVA